MVPDIEFNLVYLTSHDYLLYASQDYGATARPVYVLNNYALMYGLNRQVREVRRLLSGNIPHYDEDLPRMPIYATPARPTHETDAFSTKSGGFPRLERRPRVGDEFIGFEANLDLDRATWNSVGESLLWAMETAKINIPKLGVYYRLSPLVTFYFYTIGQSPPSIFRIGKKHSVARLHTVPLKGTRKSGRFRPTCPVNVIDLPDETEIIRGALITVPPAPLLFDAELDGEYIEGQDSTGTIHQIPVPNVERFASSWAEVIS